MRRSETLDGDDPTWNMSPWPTAISVSKTLPSASWTMVGGLMVQLHSKIAGLEHTRSTTDVDSILHMETEAISFPRAAHALRAAGFELDANTKLAYRFRRGREQVDVMCSDVHKSHRGKTFEGRELFGVPGGRRALMDTWDIELGKDGPTLVIPSVRGALVLKGAAWLEDNRNPIRHLEDGLMLLACSDDPPALANALSTTSRKRVSALIDALQNHPEAWAAHAADVQSLAHETMEAVSSALGSK